MTKYRVYIEGTDHPGDYLDEIFDSYSEAEEAACEAINEIRTGAEVLNMSNPGDYEYDEDNYDLEYSIESIETEDFSSVDWYCDSCGALLNNQSGFDTSTGEWVCAQCGTSNDVSDGNIKEVY